MKNSVLSILCLVMALGMTACGQNSDSSGSSVATTTVGVCGTGYVYSSTYGCLAQSTCPSGYGLYNNQCVMASAVATCTTGYVYSSTYGCLPQSTCSTGYALYSNQCIYVGTSTTTTTTSSLSCQGSCSYGYTQTVYGCLPQGSCGTCFGYYNHYCMGGAATGYMWYMTAY